VTFSGNIVEGDWSKKEMFWKTVMAFPEPLPLKLSDATEASLLIGSKRVSILRNQDFGRTSNSAHFGALICHISSLESAPP